MKSSIVKRSATIDGRRTSTSLEDAFWKALREIAHYRQESVSHLIESISANRKQANLPLAIRLFVLEWYHDQIWPLKPSKPAIGLRREMG